MIARVLRLHVVNLFGYCEKGELTKTSGLTAQYFESFTVGICGVCYVVSFPCLVEKTWNFGANKSSPSISKMLSTNEVGSGKRRIFFRCFFLGFNGKVTGTT